MLIYNTTYLISDHQYGPWLKWLKEVHIPFMLDCGFTDSRSAKILTTSEGQNGTSVAVQFNIPDFYRLNLWDEEHAETLQNDLSERFGSDVLFFSTVMEIL